MPKKTTLVQQTGKHLFSAEIEDIKGAFRDEKNRLVFSNKTGWIIRDENRKIIKGGGLSGNAKTGQDFIHKSEEDIMKTFKNIRRKGGRRHG